MTSNDVGFVDVKEPDTRWYPAYEVRGEGIFIEFNQEDIDGWIEAHPAVIERAARLNHNYATSFIGKNHPRTITPKFLMLHTLSHLLISQLSFECGYSIASLSERLYCAEEADGKRWRVFSSILPVAMRKVHWGDWFVKADRMHSPGFSEKQLRMQRLVQMTRYVS